MGRPRNGSVYRRKSKEARESGPCWLCGQPIDLTLRFPHPYSATADHVQPIAHGGTSLGEMRPCHKVCNERRNDGRHDGQIDYSAPPREKRRAPWRKKPQPKSSTDYWA